MRIDLNALRAIADEIREHLGEDDDEAFWNTLDGETDVNDMLSELLRKEQLDRAKAEAIKRERQKLMEREQRILHRADKARQMIGKILDASDKARIDHPLGTITRSKPRERVEVTSLDDVPSQLCSIIKRPDMREIKNRLDAGYEIPGVRITLGDPSLTIRRT